jgi:hypothetical protein
MLAPSEGDHLAFLAVPAKQFSPSVFKEHLEQVDREADRAASVIGDENVPVANRDCGQNVGENRPRHITPGSGVNPSPKLVSSETVLTGVNANRAAPANQQAAA